MVARVRRKPDVLVVQFDRDGEEPEKKLARGGEQALLYAIGILIGQRWLLARDRLTVREADDDE